MTAFQVLSLRPEFYGASLSLGNYHLKNLAYESAIGYYASSKYWWSVVHEALCSLRALPHIVAGEQNPFVLERVRAMNSWGRALR